MLGIVVTIARETSVVTQLDWGPSKPDIISVSSTGAKDALLYGALPQLPVTLLNSVVAVCSLSHELFPANVEETSYNRVSISVGLMNLVGCWFGAMPCCHGAGGLAA